MMTRIAEFADNLDMLPAGASVLCAVSGGADSVCLLAVLRELGRGLRLTCAHYNHTLRGEESDRDEEFVRALCAEWGVPFLAGRGDVAAFAQKEGLGIEEAAREMRYAFLEKAADECGASRIATAHTADDNAETMLLNLARGAGLRGLAGIPPVRGRVVRPLLTTTRQEVEAYLAENGLPHVEDSSNKSDDFSRNRLRHAVIPVLAEINGGFLQNAARSARLLRADERYLDSLAAEFIARHAARRSRKAAGRFAFPPAPGELRLPAAELSALPRPVAARVFRRAAGGELSLVHVQALSALCAGGDPSAEANMPGMTVRREYGALVFGAAPPVSLPERLVEPGRTLPLPEAGLSLRCEVLEKCKEIHNSFNTFYFPCASICGSITVKSRREGDKIGLLGREGTHSVKKLMSDAKIPLAKRGLVPVIADEAGLIAVYGFGQARRCAANSGERIVKIEITWQEP